MRRMKKAVLGFSGILMLCLVAGTIATATSPGATRHNNDFCASLQGVAVKFPLLAKHIEEPAWSDCTLSIQDKATDKLTGVVVSDEHGDFCQAMHKLASQYPDRFVSIDPVAWPLRPCLIHKPDRS